MSRFNYARSHRKDPIATSRPDLSGRIFRALPEIPEKLRLLKDRLDLLRQAMALRTRSRVYIPTDCLFCIKLQTLETNGFYIKDISLHK